MNYKKGQFIIVPNKDKIKGKSPQLQTVYLWICSFADDDGLCFPSIQTIADCSGCSRDTVMRKISELVEIGIMIRQHRFKDNEKTTNLYQIMIVDEVGSSTQQLGGSSTQQHRTKSTLLTKPTKEKKQFIPPYKQEVIDYFKENGYKEEIAIKAFMGYEVADRHDTKGNKVNNWKQKMINVWFKPENKEPKSEQKTKSKSLPSDVYSLYQS